MKDAQLVAIVGPTASGKTALAIEIAGTYNGEIICADSRTVYRGLDVGTAKPTAEEQQRVPHHLLDVVDPGERFTVADFQQQAEAAIKDIRMRGKLPIVVGGSGLYIDALLYGFSFRLQGSESENQALANLSDDELRRRIKRNGLDLNPSDLGNRRRLERAVIAGVKTPRKRQLPSRVIIVGLNPGWEVLEQRIATRTRTWFENDGLIAETQSLINQFGEIEPFNTSPYREVWQYIHKNHGLDETRQLINRHLRQLARRQLTWFKRNQDIWWATTPDKAAKLIWQSKHK